MGKNAHYRAKRALLVIIENWQGRKSSLITSQLLVDTLHKAIEVTTLADASLDRIRHISNRIELKRKSLIKKIIRLLHWLSKHIYEKTNVYWDSGAFLQNVILRISFSLYMFSKNLTINHTSAFRLSIWVLLYLYSSGFEISIME